MKRRKRILVQVGAIVLVLLSLAALINGVFIYRSSSKDYIAMLESHTGHILRQIREDMESYPSLPWLLDYWQANDETMELPGDTAQRAEEIMRMLLAYDLENARAVDSVQAAAFSEREQKLFAEYCYLEIMPLYYGIKSSFDLEDLYCVSMETTDQAKPLFQARELTPYRDCCALGETWPFNAPLHPAVSELYAERADRTYFEQVTSTVTGVEYLLGYLPIVADGDIRGYFCASYTMTAVRNAIANNMRVIEWVNVLVIFLAAALLLVLIYFSVLKKLAFVQKSVREYRDTKDSRAVAEKLKTIRAKNEVGALADDFSDMVVELDRYTGEMMRLSAEKERIGTELSLATDIQASMLPHIFPAFPTRSEFDIYASMDPAKEVGGDFYDYFLIDDDHLCMVIADVSGKGVPAALFMMASKIILQSVAMLGHSPAEILRRTNEAICSNNEAEMFVTVWLGILELSTGKLTAASAGHEFPALRQPNGAFELYKDRHGFVIGGMEGVRYKEYEIQLEPGSKVFVYTDGVPEATSAEKELFGTERMVEALNVDPAAAPQQILRNVRACVDGFVKDAEQFDDLTMLCVEYKGADH